MGANIDLGAHERPGAVASVHFGDLDGDAVIDVADLMIVLAAWGSCGEPCCLADLDLDGQVGFHDLLEVLGRWE